MTILGVYETHSSIVGTATSARMMEEDRPNFLPWESLSHVVIPPSAIGMEFIPPSLHYAVDGSFYSQYCDVLKNIGDSLSIPPLCAPTPANIRTRMGPRILFYLLRGGLVEYALDYVTNWAEDQSPEGDGTFDEAAEHPDPNFQIYPEWADLPNCANDLDFRLVRERLGLGITENWGPYRADMELDPS